MALTGTSKKLVTWHTRQNIMVNFGAQYLYIVFTQTTIVSVTKDLTNNDNHDKTIILSYISSGSISHRLSK